MNTKMMILMAGLMVLVTAKNVQAQDCDDFAYVGDAKVVESWNYYCDDVESNTLAEDVPPASDPCCVAVPGIPCPKDVPTC